MANYEFIHEGRAFTPAGDPPVPTDKDASDARNRETERREIEWLKTAPDRVFLYVSHPKGIDGFSTRVANVHTWLGTVVSSDTVLGSRAYVGFGFNSWRRSVSCRIFGVRYVGWYFESSGQYCRLKKAKRQ